MYWVMDKTAEQAVLINRSDVNDYDLVIYFKGKRE